MELKSIILSGLIVWILSLSSEGPKTLQELLQNNDTKICLINKAKSAGYLGDDFGDETPIDGLCEQNFRKAKDIILNEVESEFFNNEDEEIIPEFKECVMKRLKSARFVENSLAIYFASETNQEEEDDELLIDLKTSFNVTLELSTLICEGLQLPQNYSELFYLYDSTPYEKVNPIKDVCIRRFIATNHLIPMRGIAFNVNPTKIEARYAECKDYVNEHFKEYERRMVEESLVFNFIKNRYPERLNDGFKECLLEVVKKEKFVERFLPLQYLPAYDVELEMKNELDSLIYVTVLDYTEKVCACVDLII
jgi:hypothetical protein